MYSTMHAPVCLSVRPSGSRVVAGRETRSDGRTGATAARKSSSPPHRAPGDSSIPPPPPEEKKSQLLSGVGQLIKSISPLRKEEVCKGGIFSPPPKTKRKPEGDGLRHVGSAVLSVHIWRHSALFFPLLFHSPPKNQKSSRIFKSCSEFL